MTEINLWPYKNPDDLDIFYTNKFVEKGKCLKIHNQINKYIEFHHVVDGESVGHVIMPPNGRVYVWGRLTLRNRATLAWRRMKARWRAWREKPERDAMADFVTKNYPPGSDTSGLRATIRLGLQRQEYQRQQEEKR